MRLSADSEDDGYAAFVAVTTSREPYIYVYLDGEAIDQVVTADDVLGLVVRYKRLANGELALVGEGEGATILRETLEGEVVIETHSRPRHPLELPDAAERGAADEHGRRRNPRADQS